MLSKNCKTVADQKTDGEIPHTHRTGRPTPVKNGVTPGEPYQHTHKIPETIYMHVVYQSPEDGQEDA